MADPQSGPDAPSPFIGQLRLPPSAVARKGGMLGPVVGGVGVALLGVFVFASLNAHRTQTPAEPGPAATLAATGGAVGAGAMPAPLPGSAPAMVIPTPAGMGVMPAPPAMPQQPGGGAGSGPGGTGGSGPGASISDRLHAPSLVVDLGGGGAGAVLGAPAMPGSGGNGGANAASHGDKDGESDNAFSARLAKTGAESVSPTHLSDNARVAPQGTIIPAVLETAINSDLPGYTRAVVSRDVRGYDGTTVLIPRGSRLIGQYRNALAVGQSRAFVVWTRLITPAGLSLDIQSPGTDSMGRTGLEGETHSHFFSRFGNAILLSVINAGLQAGANSIGNPSTAIIIGSQAQATNVATMALQKEINVPTTVIVHQGTPIQVFVARDLDFTGVVGPSRR